MASYKTGDIQKLRKSQAWHGWLKLLCFGGCCILLSSNMVDFVKCDSIMERAHCIFHQSERHLPAKYKIQYFIG